MIQDGGFYYVIGYGQNIDIPTIDVISREISFIGNLVGTYVDLQDLMTLTAQGKVTLHTTHVSARRHQRRDGGSRQRAAPGPRHPRPGLRRHHRNGQDPPLQPRRPPAAAGGRRRAGRHGQGHARPQGPQRRARAPDRRADDHQRRRLDRARDRARRTRSRTWARSSCARSPTRPATSPATARRPRRCWPRGSCARACARSSEGANPMLLRRGIEIATERVVEELRRQARPVSGRDDLRHVATIAGKEDERIGEAVAEALDHVGEEGVVTVEEPPLPGISRRVRRGHAGRERDGLAVHGDRPGPDGDGLRGPVRLHDDEADLGRPGPDAAAQRGHEGAAAAGDPGREGRRRGARDARAQRRARHAGGDRGPRARASATAGSRT